MLSDITTRVRSLRENQTPAEKELWQQLRKNKLKAKFIRQKPFIFQYNNKKRYFIADFFQKLGI